MIEVLKTHQYIAICAPAAAQKAAYVALTSPQDHIKEMISEYDRKRYLIFNELNRIEGFRCRLPRGGFYIFPNITELMKEKGKKL